MTDRSRDMARLAYKAIDEKKGDDIKVLDISDVSVIADYFIICSGNSAPQIDAITSNVIDTLLRAGIEPKRTEGRSGSGWILLDYGDAVVHIFSRDDRKFYDLERVWRDGRVIPGDEL